MFNVYGASSFWLTIEYIILRVFLLLVILFSNSAFAHWLNPFPYIFETELEKVLGIYRLSPSIKNNKDFMEGVLDKYGTEITDKLITAHPFIINKPEGKIDLKTVTWFVSEFEYSPLDPDNIKRLIYVPFWNENKTANSNYPATLSSIEVSLTHLYPSFTDKLLFEDINHFESFLYEFKKNNFEKPVKIIKDTYGISNSNLAQEIAAKTMKMIKTKKLYIIEPTNIPKDDYILSIVGHGKPGEVVIASDPGVNGERILLTAKEVADKIYTQKLNGASRLDLITCSSAATKYPYLEEEEAKKAFLNNKLAKHFVDDDKIATSFLYQFSKSIFENDPDWQGKVVGNYGVLSIIPIDTYIRDPENTTQLIKEKNFSSEVVYQGYLGKYFTAFDKDSLSKTYSSIDFL